MSLNPCCNGIYSMRGLTFTSLSWYRVLILVVMEYTQWDINKKNYDKKNNGVLILVVMEYTQWE